MLALGRRLEQRPSVAGAFEGDDQRLGPHVVQVAQAEAQGAIDQPVDCEPKGRRFEVGDLEVVANVKARIRHDDAAEECRQRGFAVERVRAVDDQTRVDRLLASLFRIECRDLLTDRQRRRAAAAGDDSSARGRRINVHLTGHRERLHECTQPGLVGGFYNQVERVLTLHDGLALYVHAVLTDVGPAQVVQEVGAKIRILRWTTIGSVLMSHDEQSHDSLRGNYCST